MTIWVTLEMTVRDGAFEELSTCLVANLYPTCAASTAR